MEFNEQILMRAYNSDIDSDVRSYVLSCYKFLFNKDMPDQQCSNCIHDAAVEILTKIMDKRKYIVFAHIPIFHKGKWHTQPTLSDEDAEAYLNEHPEDAHKFKRLPKTTTKPSK